MPHIDFIGSDGKPWPSATQLTSLLPQQWIWSWYKSQVKAHGWRGWQKCLATSKRGMTIGTEVHGLLETFIKPSVEMYQSSGKYNSQQFADALFDYGNPLTDEWVEIEPHLVSEELKIHGTADAIVRINYEPGLWVYDWKTSAQKSKTHPIQLAIYKMCWDEMHPEQKLNGGIIFRIDKKSKKLTVHRDDYRDLTVYYPIIKALRIIWEYTNV